MKILLYKLILVTPILLTSCNSKQSVDLSTLQITNNQFYLENTDSLFYGTATSYY